MPSQAPRSNTSKKQAQLACRKEGLVHALRANLPQEKLLVVAEHYRTAYISYLKARLHWEKEAIIIGTGSSQKEVLSNNAQNHAEHIKLEMEKWQATSAEEVLLEFRVT